MAYLGHSPTNAGSFIEIDDYGSSFNGSTTAFTLQVGGVDVTPNAQNLLVMIDGVLQMPGNAYSVSGSTITYTEAPASGADSYVVLMGQSASIGQGTIGADELKISGDGTSGQLLKSDGDGTYSYLNQTSVTAGTATTLATARTINGVSFDGSANITVTADANTLSNTTLKSTVVNSSLTSVGTLTSLSVDGAITQSSGTLTIKNASSDSNGLKIFQDTGDASKIYNHYNGTLQLGVGSTTAITITSSEYVGIGASPSSGLHLTGGDNTASKFTLTNTANNNSWSIHPQYNDQALRFIGDSTTVLTMKDTGQVGIGTTSILEPTYTQLEVKQSSDATGIALTSGNSNSDARNWGLFTNYSAWGSLDFRYSSGNNNTPKTNLALALTKDGNVGIGVSPNAPLQFSNDADTRKIVLYEGANNDYQFYGFGVEASTLVYSTYTTSDDHVFFAGTGVSSRNELMRIGGDGFVGIGQTNPVAPLHIKDVNDMMILESTQATGRNYILFKDTSASKGFIGYGGSSSDNLSIYNYDVAAVVIGTSNLSRWNFASNGNFEPEVNNGYNIGSTSKRVSVLYTANSVNVSDRTTKTEITNCDLGVDFINTLQPKSYKMEDLPKEHDDYDRKHYGLIAQDLIDTELNDSVFGEQDGEYSLAYNDLIAPMIKAIQELSAKVEALENA